MKRYTGAQQDLPKVLDMQALHGPDPVIQVAQLELGRVYQKMGDTAKARIDLPLLKEAKAEYAKLQ
jgi:hypothetical protein